MSVVEKEPFLIIYWKIFIIFIFLVAIGGGGGTMIFAKKIRWLIECSYPVSSHHHFRDLHHWRNNILSMKEYIKQNGECV